MSHLPAGKLPNDILAQLLSRVSSRDPRVIVGPGVGRDAAVIDNGGPKLLIAKSDPITFATALIGWYTFLVPNRVAAPFGRHLALVFGALTKGLGE